MALVPRSGPCTSTPTAGRSCWRGPRSPAALREWFAERRIHRGRDRDPADFAGQRDPSACFRTELQEAAGRDRRLPADLAGIRLQEVVGGRRAPGLRVRSRLPQPRARAAAPSRVHHAGVVSGATSRYELLIDDCMALMACAARGGRRPALLLSRAQRRSLRRAGAPDGRRSIQAICRHRPAGGAAGGGPDRDAFVRWRRQIGIRTSPTTIPGAMYSAACWSERIEPRLGHRPGDDARTNIRPSMAALARPKTERSAAG